MSAKTLPDGIYRGYWSGYELKIFTTDGVVHYSPTQIGVRGLNVPVMVAWKAGELQLITPENEIPSRFYESEGE